MGKHSSNRTANAVYSSAERARDKRDGGYGTTRERLSRDSLQEADACCLSLQPAEDPWVTPEGYLYDRAAILTNLLHQKQEITRRKEEYQRAREAERESRRKRKAEESEEAVAAFRQQAGIATIKHTTAPRGEGRRASSGGAGGGEEEEEDDGGATTVSGSGSGGGGHAAAALRVKRARWNQVEGSKGAAAAAEAAKKTPAFWVPSVTPDATGGTGHGGVATGTGGGALHLSSTSSSLSKKPSGRTRCPMSGKPLRLKDLIKVNFTPVDAASTTAMVARADRYMCPVTRVVLRGGTRAVVLKPTGRVVTAECVERLVRPDMVEPISGEQLQEADIIPLQHGASGFAAKGGKALMAESSRAALTTA